MVELGADWSYASITGAQCVAAGVKAAGRYLGTDGRCITAAEYQDLRAHGIGVWLIREGGASGMLNGRAQGVSDARVAQAQINAVGLPSSSVVYATADFDVQDSQFPFCDDYLRGFASILGAGRVGIYGGLHYLNHVHLSGLASRFWQAGATSWDHGEAPLMTLHLHQTTNTPPLPGTDHNYILNAAFAGGGATPIAQEDEMKLNAIRNKDGSIGIVDDAGLLYPISDPALWQSYLRLGIVQDQGGGVFWIQQTDGTVWNALTARTTQVVSQRAAVDPKAVAAAVAPLVVSAVLEAVKGQGVSLTQPQVEAAAEEAIRKVFASAAA